MAKVAAAAFVGLILLSVLPGLLRAPDPPPLGADVGLPKRVVTEPALRPPSRRRKSRRSPRTTPVPDAPAATATIGTRTRRPRHRKHRPHRTDAGEPAARRRETSPEPVPEYTPPAPPEAAPEPVAEPPPAPPSTPGDGSQEFAPH